MIVIGLWHGVTWPFVVWGVWHALGLFVHKVYSDRTRQFYIRLRDRPRLNRWIGVAGTLLTFHFVVIGWVWFALPEIELGWDPRRWVPASALRNDRSRPYLLAVDGERIAAREIVPGPRGRDAATGEALVAIESGLADGATLLAGSVGIVEEGTPVRLTGAR